jgi:hypothetical protein
VTHATNNWLFLASLVFGGGFGAFVVALVAGRRRRVEIGLITASMKCQHASKFAELRSAYTRAQAEVVKSQRAWRQHVEAYTRRPGAVIVALEGELKAAREEIHALLSIVAKYQEAPTERNGLDFADTCPMLR